MLLESSEITTANSSVKLRGLPKYLILAALCLPSLLFVWLNRDVPHFGVLQDDGVYLIDGKGLAEGTGYRIQSLPSQPFDTRYPPLYPLYLSLAWRLVPSFPANLPTALILSWLSLPVVLALLYVWCGRHQLPAPITWLVIALFALNPYLIFFVSNLVSEVFFMVFLFCAILAAERSVEQDDQQGWRRPLLAGVIAGAAYLTRTAGIVLLPAAAAYYILKKQPRRALWFVCGMLPAVAGWILWSHAHAAPERDVITVTYTNYTAVYRLNVGWDNFGVIVWHNVSALLESFGSLVFPQVIYGLLAKFILQPLGVAMILGCVRMARKGYGGLYPFFAVFYVAMLLVWPFQPNQRFILPLAPLLLAGFCFEMTHLAQLFREGFRHRDRGQRVAAYGFAVVLIAILAAGLGFQGYMAFNVLPELARNDRANAREYSRFYEWIARNLPADASVMWESDTALYLGSGRRGANFVVPPRDWYASGGDEGKAARYKTIDAFARENHLGYIAITKVGIQRNEEVLRVLAANENLERVHEDAGAILYRVR